MCLWRGIVIYMLQDIMGVEIPGHEDYHGRGLISYFALEMLILTADGLQIRLNGTY